MKEVSMSVQGMKCGGCVRAVEQKLRGVQGVKDVEVSLENSSAKVRAEDSVGEDQLLDAMRETTYKALIQR